MLYNARSRYRQFDANSGVLFIIVSHPGGNASDLGGDKGLERDRYEERARSLLDTDSGLAVNQEALEIAEPLRAPYVSYYRRIREAINAPGMSVLEIGAGTGMYTVAALEAGASVVATDISHSCLQVLRKRLGKYSNLQTQVADMEKLPFADGKFDLVILAGSLSYGDNRTVMNEIHRVLKPGGRFICVDSLNHNPVYRLNRWLQFVRGRRTRSTLQRMPTLGLIRAYRDRFGACEAEFFGSISWLTPLLAALLGQRGAARLAERWDRLIGVTRSAFKFVMVAEKQK